MPPALECCGLTQLSEWSVGMEKRSPGGGPRWSMLARCIEGRYECGMSSPEVRWPHAPEHRLAAHGTYFVTSGTYLKAHYFRGRERLQLLHDCLLNTADKYGWILEAWAVFSNHFHFVAGSPPKTEDAGSLTMFMSELHTLTAITVNRLDGTSSRKVGHNYWETSLTFEKSYFVRLNYVHQNPVKHRLVAVAEQYPWCSAAWFQEQASAGK